jgi:hypothetical protein
VATSQSLIVLSQDSVARIFPSGEKAMEKAQNVCPWRARIFVPCGHVAKLDRVVIGLFFSLPLGSVREFLSAIGPSLLSFQVFSEKVTILPHGHTSLGSPWNLVMRTKTHQSLFESVLIFKGSKVFWPLSTINIT